MLKEWVYKWVRRSKYWRSLERNSLSVHNLLDEFGVQNYYGPQPDNQSRAIVPDSELFVRVLELIELLSGEPLPTGRTVRAKWIEEHIVRKE